MLGRHVNVMLDCAWTPLGKACRANVPRWRFRLPFIACCTFSLYAGACNETAGQCKHC